MGPATGVVSTGHEGLRRCSRDDINARAQGVSKGPEGSVHHAAKPGVDALITPQGSLRLRFRPIGTHGHRTWSGGAGHSTGPRTCRPHVEWETSHVQLA
ncbi:hypothetical protein EOT10_13390 [Streptomyces antnestii]|uniref:Uncharacterized protein n=1 Tax=Streptomyces antnestii TaxID=2494256 RepID=A0A3S2WJY3_9ACTN|nr:hypothetical protein EOT10_13390 [Streptomyces sp. San01]